MALCAQHATEHRQLQVKRHLNQIVDAIRRRTALAQPVDMISLTLTGPTKSAVESLDTALIELCAGESFIRSPEEVVDEIRKFIAAEYGTEAANKNLGAETMWEIRWNSDPSISILDRWQTGGWSRRLYELITSLGCELKGWSVPLPPVR